LIGNTKYEKILRPLSTNQILKDETKKKNHSHKNNDWNNHIKRKTKKTMKLVFFLKKKSTLSNEIEKENK